MTNQVRGPSSALSSFLRERGIRSVSVRRQETSSTPPDSSTVVNLNETDRSIDPLIVEVGPSASVEETTVSIQDTSEANPTTIKRRNVKRRKKESAKKDQSDEDKGRFSTKNIAPRSNHSKKSAASPLVKFCSRCLRRFVSQDDTVCHACSSIKSTSVSKKKKSNCQRKNMDAVPSLKDLCIKLIAEYIENVEEFGDVSESITLAIAKIISKHRQLNLNTLKLFLGPRETCLKLFDCTLIEPSGYSMISFLSPFLTTLHLEMCGRIQDEQLKELVVGCPRLSDLKLQGPFLCSDKGFNEIVILPLKSLEIANANKMTCAFVKKLTSSCQELTTLKLKYCSRLGNDGIESIADLPNLKRLDLSYLGSISINTFIHVIQKIGKHLQELILEGHEQLNDEFLSVLGANGPSLVSLSLANSPNLTSEGFNSFLLSCQACLTNISLCRNVSLSDSTLIGFVNRFGATLQDLNLNGLDELSQHGLETLIKGVPHLKRLDVSWVRSINDEFLQNLLIHCNQLISISIYGCNRITESTLGRIWKNGLGESIVFYGNEYD